METVNDNGDGVLSNVCVTVSDCGWEYGDDIDGCSGGDGEGQ